MKFWTFFFNLYRGWGFNLDRGFQVLARRIQAVWQPAHLIVYYTSKTDSSAITWLQNFYQLLGPMLSIIFLKVLEINIIFVDDMKEEKW